jgi:CheY-like chemotaxis protein
MATIVYLDDDITLIKLFEFVFEDTQHDIVTFTNEHECITYCISSPPDVLFVDYRLTDMKGDEVAEQLPNTIYKILVTGDIKIDSDYFFDDTIHKPFQLMELIKAVKNFK